VSISKPPFSHKLYFDSNEAIKGISGYNAINFVHQAKYYHIIFNFEKDYIIYKETFKKT
jgi:hypothetical protein